MSDRPKEFGAGRRCVKCNAFLSTYNPDNECRPCQDKKAAPIPTFLRKKKKEGSR